MHDLGDVGAEASPSAPSVTPSTDLSARDHRLPGRCASDHRPGQPCRSAAQTADPSAYPRRTRITRGTETQLAILEGASIPEMAASRHPAL